VERVDGEVGRADDLPDLHREKGVDQEERLVAAVAQPPLRSDGISSGRT
jgi:hypothetical protein